MEIPGGGGRRRCASSRDTQDPDLDDDLLFDLEPDTAECERRRRSASADSVRSGRVRVPGLCVDSYEGDTELEGGGPAVARVRSFKLRQEEWYGSLPGHHNASRHRRHVPEVGPHDPPASQHHHQQPRLHQAAFSVPAAGCWDEDSPGLASPEYASSVSSVEEATEFASPEYHNKLRRKTFNHLDIEDQVGSVAKSPKFLPKFLRASFSKLLKDKPKTEAGVSLRKDGSYLRTWAVSTPVSRSPSINLDTPDHELELPEPGQVSGTCTGHVSPDYSPTTGQFVAECLAKGLPIIPFNYSTAEIVEKRRQTQRRKPTEVVTVTAPSSRGARSRDPSEPGSPVERTPAPEWSEAGSEEDKSLEGLLTLARREMQQEAQLRKISGITGYAANNSRALQRRRSSVSEYVKSQDEEDEEASGDARPGRVIRHPSKRRLRKHVLRQESYEAVSPQFYFSHHEVLPQHARSSAPSGCRSNAHTRRAASLDQYLDMNCHEGHV